MINPTPTSIPDPNLKLPPAVLAAAARSEEMFKLQSEQPSEEPEQQSEEFEQQNSGSPETSAQDMLDEREQSASTTQKTASTSKVSEDDESWEHRYKSMKGRFDRSQDQIRYLTDQIAGLQNVIATMQQPPAAGAAPAETLAERLITPEEEQDYGSEFLAVVGKKAKEELAPVIGQYEKKIRELEQRLAGVGNYVEQDAKSRMFSQLDERMPQWRELNRDKGFLDWLKLPDAYSGVIRHELLKAAYERNDGPRVLAFFDGFLAEEAAVAPETSQQDLGAPAPNKVSLDKFSAPGRAKSAAATTAPAEKPLITRAQIAKFYADVNAGKYRGREADKDRQEKVIFEATRDGRIR